jgi:transposase-like protein
MSIPPILSISNILSNKDQADDFLYSKGVFYIQLPCPKCSNLLPLDRKRKVFRCDKKACNTQFSYRKLTFFFNSRLNCAQILHLAYNWLNRYSQSQCINQTGHSSETVTAFYRHFRRLVGSTLEEEDTIVGGPGIVVQIDETKLGKRKYNRGHRVDGVWVLAGVEITNSRKIFLVKVEDRKAETILEVIRHHVAPGSIIHTDMFKAYSRIDSILGFEHHTVNHSQTFKNPENGVHTNTIEGNNNALKLRISPRNRTKEIADHLLEFIWRRKNHANVWNSFISALKDIHYDIE